MLSDTQISELRRGDQLVDDRGVRWTATTDARLERSGQRTHEIYIVSASGGQSARLTYRIGSAFRRAEPPALQLRVV